MSSWKEGAGSGRPEERKGLTKLEGRRRGGRERPGSGAWEEERDVWQ